jgi:hypothetical protein
LAFSLPPDSVITKLGRESILRELAEKGEGMTENTNRGVQEAQVGAREWLRQMQQLSEQIQKQQQNTQQMM